MWGDNMLTRDVILGLNDCQVKPFNVPEWGGSVYLREMSVKDRESFFDTVKDGKIKAVKALILAACDEDGQPIFTDEDTADLEEKSGSVVDKIVMEWVRMNGLHSGAVKDAEKK